MSTLLPPGHTLPTGKELPGTNLLRAKRLARAWPDIAVVSLICLSVAYLMHWFWAIGPTRVSDLAMSIYRTFVLDRSVQQGIYFPRWGMDLNFTYGAPLFQYKSPLAHYGILAFHWNGLGWVEAAKALATFELLLSGLGMYVSPPGCSMTGAQRC